MTNKAAAVAAAFKLSNGTHAQPISVAHRTLGTGEFFYAFFHEDQAPYLNSSSALPASRKVVHPSMGMAPMLS